MQSGESHNFWPSEEKDVVQISLDCLAGTDSNGVISPFLKNSISIQYNSKKNLFWRKSKIFWCLALPLWMLYERHTSGDFRWFIYGVLILGWCPSRAASTHSWQHQVPFPWAARTGVCLPVGVWGAVGYPACCPCTALLQCIIRAELKMAAGIWFLFLYFVSLGSTAQSCCKWGCDMGLMTLVLGSLQSTTWVCSAQLEKE